MPDMGDEDRVERDRAVAEPVRDRRAIPRFVIIWLNRPKNGSYIQRHMVATAIEAMITGR